MTKPQRTGTDLGERKILADINEYGWHAPNVIEDEGHPPWTFTIGLYETWQHPSQHFNEWGRCAARRRCRQDGLRGGEIPSQFHGTRARVSALRRCQLGFLTL